MTIYPVTGKMQVSAPPIRFAEAGIFLAEALGDKLLGAHFFNKFAGETQEQSALRCSWNQAPGASNEASDRVWAGPLPTFFDGYARFRNDGPLITRIPDWGVDGGCFIACARTLDTGVGGNSQARAPVVANYGNTANKGFIFEFSAWSTGQARLIDFAQSAPTTAVVTTLATAATDLGKWRIYFGSSGPDGLKITNLSGDGSSPDPAAVALTGGRQPGAQTFAIGGRITTGTQYDAAIEKDISWVLNFDAPADAGQTLTLLSQAQRLAKEDSIGLLTTSP